MSVPARTTALAPYHVLPSGLVSDARTPRSYCCQPTQAAPPSMNAISAWPKRRASIEAPSEPTAYNSTGALSFSWR